MGHNSGQNIDDILKKLKASVESSDKAAVELEDKDKNAEPSEMSADVLQNELRNQFMTGDEVSDTENVLEGEDSYNIDDDFLSEAVAEEESVAEEAEIETVIEAEAEKESDTEVEAEVEEEIEADIDVDAGIDAEVDMEELPWEEEPVVAEEFVEAEELVGVEAAEEGPIADEIFEDEAFEEEITEEETFEEEVFEDEDFDGESEEEYEYYESLDDEVIELLTENISGEEFNEWLNEDDEDDEYDEYDEYEEDEDDEDVLNFFLPDEDKRSFRIPRTIRFPKK